MPNHDWVFLIIVSVLSALGMSTLLMGAIWMQQRMDRPGRRKR